MEATERDLEIGVWCRANERKIIGPILVFRRKTKFMPQCYAYSSIVIWTVTFSFVSRSESVNLCFVGNTENTTYVITHIV
jgi:hypothetical protein